MTFSKTIINLFKSFKDKVTEFNAYREEVEFKKLKKLDLKLHRLKIESEISKTKKEINENNSNEKRDYFCSVGSKNVFAK